MKTTIKQYATDFVYFFILFTVFSLATHMRSSYAVSYDTQQACQSSQRGMRCGTIKNDGEIFISTSQIDDIRVLDNDVCGLSSRGTRCMNNDNEVVVMILDETPLINTYKSNCDLSARGTRCGDVL